MPNRTSRNSGSAGAVAVSTRTAQIDGATMKQLLKEGMEIRRSIERSADRMFAVASDSSIRMR
jgi:hypothetical protein